MLYSLKMSIFIFEYFYFCNFARVTDSGEYVCVVTQKRMNGDEFRECLPFEIDVQAGILFT